MNIRIDLTGQRFGQLKVIGPARKRKNTIQWKCLCSCGQIRWVARRELRKGDTTSCGCYIRQLLKSGIGRTHEESKRGQVTPEYRCWQSIKRRCYNPNTKDFKGYGDRGITVCDRWLNSFENFLTDMGRRPDKLTIERIDTDGPYSPDNCYWATRSQQSKNQRRWRILSLNPSAIKQREYRKRRHA